MFWSILLGWALVGMVLEAAACMCTAMYAAACADSAGLLDNSTAENVFRKKIHDALKKPFPLVWISIQNSAALCSRCY